MTVIVPGGTLRLTLGRLTKLEWPNDGGPVISKQAVNYNPAPAYVGIHTGRLLLPGDLTSGPVSVGDPVSVTFNHGYSGSYTVGFLSLFPGSEFPSECGAIALAASQTEIFWFRSYSSPTEPPENDVGIRANEIKIGASDEIVYTHGSVHCVETPLNQGSEITCLGTVVVS